MNRTTAKLIGTSKMAFRVQRTWKDKLVLALKVCVLQGHYFIWQSHNITTLAPLRYKYIQYWNIQTQDVSESVSKKCRAASEVWGSHSGAIEEVTLRPVVQRFQTFRRNVSPSLWRLGRNRRRSFKRQEPPLTQRHGGTSQTRETLRFVFKRDTRVYTLQMKSWIHSSLNVSFSCHAM